MIENLCGWGERVEKERRREAERETDRQTERERWGGGGRTDRQRKGHREEERLCRVKHTFVATKDVFCRDKHVFVATKVSLSRQSCVCCGKYVFVATKLLLQQTFYLGQLSPMIPNALLLTPACWKSNSTNARLMAFVSSLALDPTFGIHSHKTLDTTQSCHLLKPN